MFEARSPVTSKCIARAADGPCPVAFPYVFCACYLITGIPVFGICLGQLVRDARLGCLPCHCMERPAAAHCFRVHWCMGYFDSSTGIAFHVQFAFFVRQAGFLIMRYEKEQQRAKAHQRFSETECPPRVAFFLPRVTSACVLNAYEAKTWRRAICAFNFR